MESLEPFAATILVFVILFFHDEFMERMGVNEFG